MTGLSVEYILKHSLGPKQTPHCDSSLDWRENAASEIESMGYAIGYAEPGYDQPEKGILFANWNHFPKRVADVLEHAGFSIEWSDKWTNCEDCNKAVRTSPDGYDWQRYYVVSNECSIVCLNCVDWSEYLSSIEDNPDHACMAACDPSEHGYALVSQPAEYENGFHHGQNDKPRDIFKRLQAQGKTGLVFRISETSQFYITFEVWQKEQEQEADSTEQAC